MKDCRGELLYRVRNGVASDQEQTAFEAHLGSCESCQMSVDVMTDLDSAGEPEPGDWARVAQMADAGVIAFGRGVPTRPRLARRSWRLGVAALVLTGAAAAGVVASRTVPNSAPQKGQSVPSVPVTRPASPTSSPKVETPETTLDSEEPVEQPKAEATVPTQEITPPSKVAPPATASETYRAANDARRAGQASTAIQGYQRLQKHFPSSPEAHASRVSLGGLLLRSGSAQAALRQFDAYLASSGGQLTAEALFGRAQSLRALGRSAEEAQNLQRLVSSYPNSAYATHAQRRLAELR